MKLLGRRGNSRASKNIGLTLAISLLWAITAQAEQTLPELIYFVIEPGTGSNAWNHPDDPLLVYPGQTIRIMNMDSESHQLHSSSSYFCDHQPGSSPAIDTQKGLIAYYDCTVPEDSDYDATVRVGTYDHNHGRSAAFYVKVVPLPE